ncbi:MAG: hypothetical protein KDD56_03175, partial [Bdellovibrionales bacterium]|nr:hypothetical protein [Bdellovibrionales bacterium]
MTDQFPHSKHEPDIGAPSEKSLSISATLDEFSTLNKLLSRKSAAPCLLYSEDPSLQIFSFETDKKERSIPKLLGNL